MKRCPGHIVALVIAVLALLPSCRKDEGEVIPRSDLSRIYAEMLLTDQWIIHTPNMRNIADTSLVYEPILERYGYDSDDYRKSVDVYMDDPERFARIFRDAGEILTARLEALQVERERLAHLEMLRKNAEKYRPDIEWKLTASHKEDTLYVALPDSLVIERDSSSIVYRIAYVTRRDTVYNGVRMVTQGPDTLKAETPDTSETHEIVPRLGKIDTLPGVAGRKLRQALPEYTRMNDGDK